MRITSSILGVLALATCVACGDDPERRDNKSVGDDAQLASVGDDAQLASVGDDAQLASVGDDAQLAKVFVVFKGAVFGVSVNPLYRGAEVREELYEYELRGTDAQIEAWLLAKDQVLAWHQDGALSRAIVQTTVQR